MNEDQVSTGDMASGFSKITPDSEFNGEPCFDIDCSDEYNSFCKGIKTFHRWNKHTRSENIRQWANQNRGKSFYVTHNGSYTKVNRGKK